MKALRGRTRQASNMAGRSVRKAAGEPSSRGHGRAAKRRSVLDISRTVYSVSDCVPDPTIAGPFSDVKLISASGAILYGSKYNLAERSVVLNRMLLNGMKETTPAAEMAEIRFPEMSTEALRFLLEFCCTGSVAPVKLREIPVEVIHVSRYFQLWEHTDEMSSLTLTNLRHHLIGNDVSNLAAATLSKALDYLSPELDGKFFDYLLRVLLARPLQSVSCSSLTSKALAFLLSRSLESSDLECDPLPCATPEFSIFLYVLLWCAHQVSKETSEQVGEYVALMTKYSAELRNHEEQTRLSRHIRASAVVPEPKAELGSQVKPKVATVFQPFLHLIEYKLMHPKELSLIIRPLQIVPQEVLLQAFCQQAADFSYRGPVMYRGPFVLQWEPTARDTYMFPNPGDGKELRCSTGCGFARTVSPAIGTKKRRRYSKGPKVGGQVYKWDFVINQGSSTDIEFGIGLCTDQDRNNMFPYSVWLGDQANGWILDGHGRFWHNKNCIPAANNIFWPAPELRVTVHLDMGQRSCSFSCGVRSCTAPWDNIPDEVYPAVTCKSSRLLDRVSIRVEPSQSLE